MLIFFYLVQCYGMFQRNITHTSTEHYTIHQSQLSTPIIIEDAVQIKLEKLQNETICEAKQRSMIASTLEYSHFGEEQTLIALVQLTLDSYLIYQQNQSLIYKNNDRISGYSFVMNTNQYIQMIRLEEDVLILSKDEAYLLEMDTFGNYSMLYREVQNWQKRNFRRLTKLFNITGRKLLLSAIGEDGLEAYEIQGRNITFLFSIQNYQNIVDFCVVNNDLFILDSRVGLVWYQVDVTLNSQLKQIDNAEGGIAVDSYNGVNVFVAYKWARYAVVEYVVNSTTKMWYKHNMIYTGKIFDVDATRDFAIIQGSNHHLVLFNYHLPDERTTLRHFQLRDFDVFYEQGSVYFSGITSKSYVLSELTFMPPRIQCFSDKVGDFSYLLSYTKLMSKGILHQHVQPIQVYVVDTYIYEESMIIVIIGVSGFMISVIIAVLYLITRNRSYSQQIVLLMQTIGKQDKQAQNQEVPQMVVQSNLQSAREPKDDEYLNIKQQQL